MIPLAPPSRNFTNKQRRLRLAAYRGRGWPLEWEELLCSCGDDPLSESGTVGVLLHLAANLAAYPSYPEAATQTGPVLGFPASEVTVQQSHASVGTDPYWRDQRRVVKCAGVWCERRCHWAAFFGCPCTTFRYGCCENERVVRHSAVKVLLDSVKFVTL